MTPAGLYTDPLFTYTTVISVKNGKREDRGSSSYRLSVVMLVMGRERKLSRSSRGESKQKISEKGKMKDDVDGVYRAKHVLGKYGWKNTLSSDGNFQRSFFVVLACNFFF